MNTNSENYKTRALCALKFDLDFIGIGETFRVNNQTLKLDGYSWFCNNRENLHPRASRGSGGVGFFVRNSIIHIYNVSILDDSVEGILWLKCTPKTGVDEPLCSFTVCVCYLPPQSSSRNIDARMFLTSCSPMSTCIRVLALFLSVVILTPGVETVQTLLKAWITFHFVPQLILNATNQVTCLLIFYVTLVA